MKKKSWGVLTLRDLNKKEKEKLVRDSHWGTYKNKKKQKLEGDAHWGN